MESNTIDEGLKRTSAHPALTLFAPYTVAEWPRALEDMFLLGRIEAVELVGIPIGDRTVSKAHSHLIDEAICPLRIGCVYEDGVDIAVSNHTVRTYLIGGGIRRVVCLLNIETPRVRY